MMVAMGLPEKKCKKALSECNNDVERAIEWAFSHDDVEDEPEDSVMNDEEIATMNDKFKCDKPGVYNLQSFITHLGSSVHCGHYVAHVLKNESTENQTPAWIYYNDEKVVKTSEPPIVSNSKSPTNS